MSPAASDVQRKRYRRDEPNEENDAKLQENDGGDEDYEDDE